MLQKYNVKSNAEKKRGPLYEPLVFMYEMNLSFYTSKTTVAVSLSIFGIV